MKKVKKTISALWKKYHTSLWKFFFIGAGLLIISLGIFIVWVSAAGLPDFKAFDERKVELSTKIYDRTGEIVLYNIHQDIKRTVVPFEDISQNVKNATVAIEDASFYTHSGIRPTSLIRATFDNIFSLKFSQGGSTITQQIVKNTLLTKEKTITRKIKEIVLSLKIERELTKDQILAIYLNESPYGGNIYGVTEAARTFFGKEANTLTLAESAYIAAIPQLPTFYSPYGKNREKLDQRKNLVLSRMNELGMITDEEEETAKAEVITFKPKQDSGIKAPHFVFYIKEYLEKEYGTEVVEQGGLSVITTLDYELQSMAEPIVKEQALKNTTTFNAKNAALVAIDPKTGQILTMVGSRDYFDKEIDGNFNVATAKRQPGSSFKPFVYAAGFNVGYRPETVLFDVKTEFQGGCNAYGQALPGTSQSSCYSPENFDGLYKGPMKIRNALGESRNVPAVKMLYLVGVDSALKLAKDMGITTLLDKNQYGLSLVLGGGEVQLLEMTSAYGVFAADGVRHPYTGILKVTDSSGRVLEEYKEAKEEALPKQTALLISDILADQEAKVPTFGRGGPLTIPGRQVAVKTGTTNNNRDGWVVGYTPSLAVGVWTGNNENTPMKRTSAAVAGPLWNAFMVKAVQKYPVETFEKPQPITETNSAPIIRGYWQGGEGFIIDTISKKLATELTPEETREEVVLTNVHSILYWIDKDNPLGPRPTNPGRDPQFNRWETAVQNWWASNASKYPFVSSLKRPSGYDDVHTEEKRPKFQILTPESRSYISSESITVTISDQSVYGIKKIDVFLNGIYIGTDSQAPYSVSFIPKDTTSYQEYNELKVIAQDMYYNRKEITKELILN